MASTQENRDSYLTTVNAAKILGVALPTIHDWVEKGVLRAWRTPGGHRRISKSSLESFLQRRQQELENGSTPRAVTILVVEDDSVMLTMYESMIDSWGLPVTLITATNGFDGLIQVGKNTPDIIITDLAMPDMDGFQMIRNLEKRPELENTRIIAVTALHPAEIQKRGGLPANVLTFQKPAPGGRLKSMVQERIAALGSTGKRA